MSSVRLSFVISCLITSPSVYLLKPTSRTSEQEHRYSFSAYTQTITVSLSSSYQPPTNKAVGGNSALSDENNHSEQQTAGPKGKKPTKEDVGFSDSVISLGKEEHSEGVIKKFCPLQHETRGHGVIQIVTPGYNRDALDYSLLIEE